MVTRRSDIAGRLEPVAFGIVLALHLVPVWTVHYFPTQDGPAHVYNTAQFLTLLAGDPLSSRYYATNLHPFPNWATTVLFAGFLRIVSAVTAEKFVVSLYVLGLPLSERYLLTGRRAGAGWLGWLTLPLVYNDFLHRGFYNFLLGIVVMCLVVGYWLRHRSRPSPARLATFCALATLLYFCHLVAFGAAGIALGILTVSALAGVDRMTAAPNGSPAAARREWRRAVLWMLCLLPGVILALQFVLSQHGSPSYSNYRWKTVAWVFYAVTAAENTPIHLIASMLVPALWGAGLAYVVWSRHAPLKWYRDEFLVCSLTLAVLYIVLPEALAGGSFLNPRLALLALLLAVPFFACVPFGAEARRLMIAAAGCLALLLVMLNVRLNWSLQDMVEEYLSAGAGLKPNRTLVSVCLADEGCGAGTRPGRLRMSPLTHASGYIATFRHLIDLSNAQAHLTYFPVRYVPLTDPMPFQNVVEGGHGRRWVPLLPGYSLATGGVIDYVLLWGLEDAGKRGDDTTELMSWLERDFQLSMTSSRGRVRVYTRRDE